MTYSNTRETVNVHGTDLDLRVFGSGEPVLFLHSGPGPTYDSQAFVDELSRHFTVLAPYHPGFGALPRPQELTGIDDLAYVYLDFMQARGLRGIPVVGASVGGWIAAEVAVRDAAAFSRLVLINPLGVRVGKPTDRPIADLWAITRGNRRRLEFHQTRFQDDDLATRSDEEIVELSRYEDALAYYAWKPFLHNPKLLRWLHRIAAPTLVIRGAEDKLVAGKIHEAFCSALPRGRLVAVAGAGHHPHVEEPAVVAELVFDFIKSS